MISKKATRVRTKETPSAMRAALKVQLNSSRRKASGTAKGRHQAEQDAQQSKTDSRFTNRGETKLLIVAVKVEWRTWITDAAAVHDMHIFEIAERGLELVGAELEAKRHA